MKRIVASLAIVMVVAVNVLAQSGRWEILRAEYGSGGTWVDVTTRVRSLVREDSLNIRVTNDMLGGDPAPGSPKTLRLRVRNESGHVSVLSFPEKESIGLSIRTGGPGWGTLQITRAEYGANKRFMDVVDLLNSRVQGNHLSLRVTNETMGGDPAHELRKVLTVWYTFNGNDSQASVKEGDTLSLPGSARSYGELRLVRAEYGADNRYANVTSRLSARIQEDRLSLRVTNETMGGDPADDRHKTLTVWYTHNGRMANVAVNEGDYLNLPGSDDYFSGNLRILRAQYGAGFRHFDVTERLNSRIQSDQLSLRVTNETMGGDPADDKHKQLSVFYICNGQQSRITVDEGDYLTLPGSKSWNDEGSSGGLQILQATYGAGDHQRNVTDRVSAQVSGDQLQIQVSNSTMGGDPAEGQRKRLKVIYLLQGFRYQTTIAEGETLVIP
jgi:hypothetical protein